MFGNGVGAVWRVLRWAASNCAAACAVHCRLSWGCAPYPAVAGAGFGFRGDFQMLDTLNNGRPKMPWPRGVCGRGIVGRLPAGQAKFVLCLPIKIMPVILNFMAFNEKLDKNILL